MTDLALNWDAALFSADLALEGQQLATDRELQTAVIISLFTDRRALPADRLPSPGGDRRGWWGDGFPSIGGDRIGSRLWLLSREKTTEETRRRAIDYCREGLQWLIDDRIATKIEIEAEYREKAPTGMLAIAVSIVRGDGTTARFEHLWKGV